VDVDGQADDLRTPPGFSSSVPMVCDDKSTSDPAQEDDEELVDYSSLCRAHEFGHQRDTHVSGWLCALRG
jgi:hypothetical protein